MNKRILELRTWPYQRWFSVLVIACIVVYWFIILLTRSANIDCYFVTDHHDTSMDYFNMLANMNQTDAYYQQANYPAICFLFWKIMHRFLWRAEDGEFGDGFELRNDMIAQLGYIMFLAVCLVIIWESMMYLSKGTRTEKILLSSALFFSGPMFFLLERGNIMIAVLALLLLYLALYDAPKLSLRVIAYICLALAAAIKIYPALFGLLVLRKKRYKETAVLVVMGIAVFILPFFAFDGIGSLKSMLNGITAASGLQGQYGLGGNFSFSNLIKIVAAFCGYNVVSTPGWISAVMAVLCIVLYFLCTSEWQQLFALTLACLWFPSFSYTYALVMLFLPILSFLRTEHRKGSWLNWAYLILMILLVIPYALPFADRANSVLGMDYIKLPLAWGTVIANFALVLIAIGIAGESLWERIGAIKNKSQKLLSGD